MTKKAVTIDFETTDKLWFKAELIGMGVYKDGTAGWTTKVAGKEVPRSWCQTFHGGKYDLKVGWKHGVKGLSLDEDTLIKSSLLPYEEHGLEYLACRILKIQPWKLKWGKKTHTTNDIKEHCRLDVTYTDQIDKQLTAELEHHELLGYYYTYAMPFNRLLTQIEYDGIRIDTSKLKRLSNDLDDVIISTETLLREHYADDIEATEIAALTNYLGKWKTDKTQAKKRDLFEGINFNSSIQMLDLLHDMGFDPRNLEGKPTTDTRALEELEGKHPFIKDFLNYRKKTKLLQFLSAWPRFMVGDRLHFCLNQHVTKTGRLSGSDPNLQQVPRKDKVWGPEFRSLFLPDEGEVFTVVDYSQIEMRIAAHYSQDPVLIQAIKEGIDYYGLIATRVLGLECHPNKVKELHPGVRDTAKVIGLGHALYGMGTTKLAQTVGCSFDDARLYARDFAKELPVLNQYKYSVAARGKAQGYLIGLFGRKLWFDEETPMHVPFNHLVQNAASELTAFTQIKVQEELKGKAKLKLLVHDEVLYSHKRIHEFEVDAILWKHMVTQFEKKLRVPLNIDISTGENWSCKG